MLGRDEQLHSSEGHCIHSHLNKYELEFLKKCSHLHLKESTTKAKESTTAMTKVKLLLCRFIFIIICIS